MRFKSVPDVDFETKVFAQNVSEGGPATGRHLPDHQDNVSVPSSFFFVDGEKRHADQATQHYLPQLCGTPAAWCGPTP